MPKKVVVIGSSNIDFVMKAAHLPQVGETVTNASFIQTFGGKGANQAVAVTKAGGDAWFVTCIGDDSFGIAIKENLRLAGVRVDYVIKEKGTSSGIAMIMVDDSGANIISVAPGANHRLTPKFIQAIKPVLRDARLVILQYEILPETVYEVLDSASAVGKPILFNLAPAQEFDPARLSKITYLVVNETEAQTLCGFPVTSTEQVIQAADALLAKGVQTVIITLGAQGVYVASKDGLRQKVAAFQVDAIDTTAAGDVFCGAFGAALMEGTPLIDAVRFASAASAISVTRMGAQPSIPSRAEINDFLTNYRFLAELLR